MPSGPGHPPSNAAAVTGPRTASAVAIAGYPTARERLPTGDHRSGVYRLHFAQSPQELDQILRLRFEVFNLELAEGLEESYHTGRDEDELDARFHHLAITVLSTAEIVGTYRMQTGEMAQILGGFYSGGEFDLSGLPPEVVHEGVEIGRACVARDHRNGRVLQLMWRGLAQYLTWNGKRYLFGCCSLNSQDQDLGHRVYQALLAAGHGAETWRIDPLPGFECAPDRLRQTRRPDVHVPALFQSYLNLGAKICGPPAIDRRFRTIDFLVCLDIQALDPRVFRTFFG